MRVGQEITALQSMGISLTRFIVMPRLVGAGRMEIQLVKAQVEIPLGEGHVILRLVRETAGLLDRVGPHRLAVFGRPRQKTYTLFRS